MSLCDAYCICFLHSFSAIFTCYQLNLYFLCFSYNQYISQSSFLSVIRSLKSSIMNFKKTFKSKEIHVLKTHLTPVTCLTVMQPLDITDQLSYPTHYRLICSFYCSFMQNALCISVSGLIVSRKRPMYSHHRRYPPLYSTR